MSDRAILVQIYIAFYNRAPDPEGLNFWQGACDAGLSLSEIAELFVPQDESIATYPFLGNPTEEGIRNFLKSVYENLFNREIDTPGETFWTNQILKSLSGEPGGLSIGEVVLSIITGAQGDDVTTLANKTEVALDFHDQAAALDDYVQNSEATTASRLALSVVDETDFSVVQGKVLNENYFEEFDGQGNPLFEPFEAGLFDPIVGPAQTALSEVQVNGLILGNQISSDVAVLADGKVVTAYTITADGPNYVAFNIRNADGSLSLPDGQLLTVAERAAGGIANSAEVVALPDGGFIIAARTFPDGAGDASITAFRLDATGARISDPVEIVGPDDFFLIDSFSVTYLPTGDLMYVVSGNEAGSQIFGQPDDIFMTIRTLDGDVVAPLQVVNDNDGTPSTEDAPAAAALPDGTTLVTYDTSDMGVDGDESAVVGHIYSPQGEPLGAPIVINRFTENEQGFPSVSALGEDRFVVVFETFSREFDTNAPGVSAVILNRDGSTDVEEFPINVVEIGSQSGPQVAELDNGNFVVAWRTSETGDGDVRARVFEDDGTPVTGDIVVNTFTNGNQGRVDLAVGKDGFVVTWDALASTIEDPFGFGIRMAAFDEDGVRLPLPQQINPTLPILQSGEFQVNDEVSGTQQQAKVVGLPDGSGVFSYLDVPTFKTFFEVRGPDGLPRGPEMEAFGGQSIFSSDIDMARTADGGFVMVGEGQTTGGPGIVMQIFDADLNPGPVIKVNSEAAAAETGPAVTVDSDGNIFVGWTLDDNINDRTVILRKYDADGTPLTSEVEAGSSVSSSGLILSSIAVNDDGQVIVLSEADDVAAIGSFADVHVSLLDNDLVRSFSGALDTDNSNGTQQNAQAVALANGNFLVVFTDAANPAGPPGFDISGLIIDSNGEQVGGTFIINQRATGGQTEPDVITLEDGRIVVTWSGFNPGFNTDVYGRILTADGVPSSNELIINPGQDLNESLSSISAAGDGFVAAWQSGITTPDAETIQGAVFDRFFDPAQTPLVLSNNEFGFLTLDQILDLQDIPLSGNPNDFFIDSFGDTALGTELFFFAGGVRYDPFTLAPEINNLAEGDQLTEIFEYTVENATGDQVTLIGSFQVQGFEDVVM